ncbi:unnamed protein product, partial [Closterium sp. NIES-54]
SITTREWQQRNISKGQQARANQLSPLSLAQQWWHGTDYRCDQQQWAEQHFGSSIGAQGCTGIARALRPSLVEWPSQPFAMVSAPTPLSSAPHFHGSAGEAAIAIP